MNILIIFMLIFVVTQKTCFSGILYPKESETRQIRLLDGLWHFTTSNDTEQGFKEKWYAKKLKDVKLNIEFMPVPSSYNDITTSWELRDFVGVVWYERTFFVPKLWQNGNRIWIRFGSVSYAADVYINGNLALSHEIGHLPFKTEITKYLNFGAENQITVACSNVLKEDSIPQGGVKKIQSGRTVQTYTYDFFNYAGIDRSVVLYTTPNAFIDDITLKTDVDSDTGIVNYDVTVHSDTDEVLQLKATLLDKKGIEVASQTSDKHSGQLAIKNVNLWWPYLMHDDPGYLYNLQLEVLRGNDLVDKYTQRIGIRTLKWDNANFLINDKPIYLRGFGRHEDSDIRGKGFDWPLVTRDHNLIKWIGANAYRTSHYPYAEEIMDLAEELGIMIIDECPAVNMEGYSDSLLANHKQSITEMFNRDKNRAAVVIWSVANEPRTQMENSRDYFKSVLNHMLSLDTSRPRSIAEMYAPDVLHTGDLVDIISVNKYNAWYSDPGDLDLVTILTERYLQQYNTKFNKPIIMSEYGADSMQGLHTLPTYIWSEEYQTQLMSGYFQAFDNLRTKGFFIGEFIWNFADFRTAQEIRRVDGNKKGIFTRNRQPKSSAFHMRKRYWGLAKELNNVTLPDDLFDYTSSVFNL